MSKLLVSREDRRLGGDSSSGYATDEQMQAQWEKEADAQKANPLVNPDVSAQAEMDKALARQQQALIRTGWDSIEEVKRNVVAAYSGGTKRLTNEQMAAMVAIAWNMSLDPSPGAGHIYAAEFGGKFTILIGYQGYLHRAQRDHKIYYNPARAMTQEERASHGLREDQVGAIVELYELDRAEVALKLGIKVQPIIGIGIWTNGDNVAKTKSGLWMAGKNAIKDAIRQLGLGFGATAIPNIAGFEYDRDTDTFTQISNSDKANGFVEAEIQSSLTASRLGDLEIEGEFTEDIPQIPVKLTRPFRPEQLPTVMQKKLAKMSNGKTVMGGSIYETWRNDFKAWLPDQPQSNEVSAFLMHFTGLSDLAANMTQAMADAIQDWSKNADMASQEFSLWLAQHRATHGNPNEADLFSEFPPVE
jgi:hypothetical protein